MSTDTGMHLETSKTLTSDALSAVIKRRHSVLQTMSRPSLPQTLSGPNPTPDPVYTLSNPRPCLGGTISNPLCPDPIQTVSNQDPVQTLSIPDRLYCRPCLDHLDPRPLLDPIHLRPSLPQTLSKPYPPQTISTLDPVQTLSSPDPFQTLATPDRVPQTNRGDVIAKKTIALIFSPRWSSVLWREN